VTFCRSRRAPPVDPQRGRPARSASKKRRFAAIPSRCAPPHFEPVLNRERLVSGLLAASEAGEWTIVTGLRRFGKSIARAGGGSKVDRTVGVRRSGGIPSEITSPVTLGARRTPYSGTYFCRLRVRRSDSIRTRVPGSSGWKIRRRHRAHARFRALVAACRMANGGRSPPLLPILTSSSRPSASIPLASPAPSDVLAILVGALRTCLRDSPAVERGERVGVLFCSAPHAALWAPLRTLDSNPCSGPSRRDRPAPAGRRRPTRCCGGSA